MTELIPGICCVNKCKWAKLSYKYFLKGIQIGSQSLIQLYIIWVTAKQSNSRKVEIKGLAKKLQEKTVVKKHLNEVTNLIDKIESRPKSIKYSQEDAIHYEDLRY